MNRFIVFEGVDGSGKSTQIKLIEQKLEQHSISFSTFREPGGNLLSEKIREILLDKDISICDESELMLFLAARGQNTEEGILKELITKNSQAAVPIKIFFGRRMAKK